MCLVPMASAFRSISARSGPSPTIASRIVFAGETQDRHGLEQFAQAFFGDQTSDVQEERGIRWYGEFVSRGDSVAQMEDSRVAAVRNYADPVCAGPVAHNRNSLQVPAYDQEPVGVTDDAPGHATTDRVSHAKVGSSCSCHERNFQATRNRQRPIGIRIEPVSENNIRMCTFDLAFEGPRAEPSIERPRNERQDWKRYILRCNACIETFGRRMINVALRAESQRIRRHG